jgi:hypothetical protein
MAEHQDHQQPPGGAWGQVLQGEQMTAALLDPFTHRCHGEEARAIKAKEKKAMKETK